MATVLLVGVDLYFRGKLEGLLQGHHLVTTDSIDPPDIVIADIARIDPDEVADTYPDVPIVGYSNHTDTAGLRAAHTAGFDQVLAKSALVERAPQVVEELVEREAGAAGVVRVSSRRTSSPSLASISKTSPASTSVRSTASTRPGGSS